MDIGVFCALLDGICFKRGEENPNGCGEDSYGKLVLVAANKQLKEHTINLLEEQDDHFDEGWAFRKFNIDIETPDGGDEFNYEEATEEERNAWEFIVALNIRM